MKRASSTGTFLLAALATSACAGWNAPASLPAAPGDVFQRAWTVPVEAAGEIQLEAAPGGFLAAAPNGTLLFVTAGTGSVAWRRDLGAPIEGAVVVAAPAPEEGASSTASGAASEGSGAWVAAPLEGGVIGLAKLGSSEPPLLWKTGWPSVALTAVGGNIFAASPEGGAALFSPAAGKVIWQKRLLPSAGVRAAVCGDRLLVGCADGHLYGVGIAEGRTIWSKQLGSPLAAPPACDGHHALAATADNVLHALRLHRRSAGIMWRIRSGADPGGPPILVDHQALLISKDTFLYGFRARSGHLAFRVRLNRRPGPAALLGGFLLVAGPHAGRLDAFHLPSGRSAGGLDLPEGTRFLTPPITSEGKVAIAFARYGENASRLLAVAPGVAAK